MRRLGYLIAGIILVAIPAAGCTDRQAAVEGAEALGLTQVQTGGHAFIGCGKDDDTATKFTATNVNGKRVRGIACSNWSPFGKATTIRIIGLDQ